MNEYIQLRRAFHSMFCDIEADLFVTLTTYPGCEISNETMLSKLRKLDAYVARRTLGRRWSKKPDSVRMNGVFVLEHGKQRNHPHWHGMLSIPNGEIPRYRGLIDNAWTRNNRWSAHFDNPNSSNEQSDWSSYILKDFRPELTGQIVFTNMLRGDTRASA
tara:strand:- start:5941 stop:6420 length:480 start_codon:yes stop_codon:yes gene_type:complete